MTIDYRDARLDRWAIWRRRAFVLSGIAVVCLLAAVAYDIGFREGFVRGQKLERVMETQRRADIEISGPQPGISHDD